MRAREQQCCWYRKSRLTIGSFLVWRLVAPVAVVVVDGFPTLMLRGPSLADRVYRERKTRSILVAPIRNPILLLPTPPGAESASQLTSSIGFDYTDNVDQSSPSLPTRDDIRASIQQTKQRFQRRQKRVLSSSTSQTRHGVFESVGSIFARRPKILGTTDSASQTTILDATDSLGEQQQMTTQQQTTTVREDGDRDFARSYSVQQRKKKKGYDVNSFQASVYQTTRQWQWKQQTENKIFDSLGFLFGPANKKKNSASSLESSTIGYDSVGQQQQRSRDVWRKGSVQKQRLRRQQQEEKNAVGTVSSTKRSTRDTVALLAIGASITLAIIYGLASSIQDGTVDSSSTSLDVLGQNIVDAVVPMTIQDTVCCVFGEATAGVVASLSSYILSIVLNDISDNYNENIAMDQENTHEEEVDIEPQIVSNMGRMPLVAPTESEISLEELEELELELEQEIISRDLQRIAFANSDFFVAKAAAAPLAQATGIPLPLARLGTVLLAAVPATLFNFAAQKKLQRDVEELERIQEEEIRRVLEKPFPLNIFFPTSEEKVSTALQEKQTTLSGLNGETIVVDLIADLIKWLGYGVVCAEFAGQIMIHGQPLDHGLESALYGSMASLSAQIYCDVFYGGLGFGCEVKKQNVRSRSPLRWVATYVQEAIAGAFLFAVYEETQAPAKFMVSAILSGGAENCIGSSDLKMCIQTFLEHNPEFKE